MMVNAEGFALFTRQYGVAYRLGNGATSPEPQTLNHFLKPPKGGCPLDPHRKMAQIPGGFVSVAFMATLFMSNQILSETLNP